MNHNPKKTSILFCVISIVILTCGFWFNPASRFSEAGVANFDLFSNDIMISDLMYRENFGVDSLFLKAITPTQIQEVNGTTDNTDGILLNMFSDHLTFQKEIFFSYRSNLTVQRVVYGVADAVLPVSNRNLVSILQFMNCFMLAGVITAILFWIRNKTNVAVAIIMMLVLAIASPALSMYGRNLYWAAWTLFLPMASMALLLLSKKFENMTDKQKNRALLLTAFIVCMIKELMYFEFITTVMISMMIPIVYYIFEKKMNLKSAVKLFLYPVVGAVLSFITVYLLLFTMISIELGSFAKAIEMLFGNLKVRLVGDLGNGNTTLADSAKASIKLVLKKMLYKPAFSIKNVLTISQFGIIILSSLISFFKIFQFKKNIKMILADHSFPMMISLWVSLLAPLSWFILAKPHTFIHDIQCSITWFIPFTLLATAFILDFFISGITIKQEESEVLIRDLR